MGNLKLNGNVKNVFFSFHVVISHIKVFSACSGFLLLPNPPFGIGAYAFTLLGPVVDNAIRRINRYPVDKC